MNFRDSPSCLCHENTIVVVVIIVAVVFVVIIIIIIAALFLFHLFICFTK